MEWRHMVVTCEQNTTAKGYGAGADPAQPQTRLLQLWADYYEVDAFASYDEVQAEVQAAAGAGQRCRYVELRIVRHGDVSKPKYFDTLVYKRRLAAVVAPWLLDSNRRASEAGTTAFCAATPLGLGAWGIDRCQRRLMHEVYAELLGSLPLPAVSDLVLTDAAELGVRAPFPSYVCPVLTEIYLYHACSCQEILRMETAHQVPAGEWLAAGGNAVRVRPAQVEGRWRAPATKLSGADTGKLLCAMYAWDGGAYPGEPKRPR
jgi:hypothetical protein